MGLKELLLNPEHKETKMIAIAFDSGFNNAVIFNKAFISHMGMTPGKYRKRELTLS